MKCFYQFTRFKMDNQGYWGLPFRAEWAACRTIYGRSSSTQMCARAFLHTGSCARLTCRYNCSLAPLWAAMGVLLTHTRTLLSCCVHIISPFPPSYFMSSINITTKDIIGKTACQRWATSWLATGVEPAIFTVKHRCTDHSTTIRGASSVPVRQ